MHSFSFLRSVIGLLSWGLLMWGALNLRHLDGNAPGGSLHSLCGPWGCGPPLYSLLAVHTFWLVVLLPPMVFAALHLRPSSGRCLGLSLLLGGLFLLLGMGIRDYFSWYCRVGSYQRQFAVQRFLFVVATGIDMPAVQIMTGGMIVLVGSLIGRRRERRAQCRRETD